MRSMAHEIEAVYKMETLVLTSVPEEAHVSHTQ